MAAETIYLHSLQQALHELFERDPDVFILGEDILDPYGGAFKVTKGLSTKFPDRVITTPICEASIVGAGAGLALRGCKAIVEIMFGDFITLVADQMVNHAAKFREAFGESVRISLVIRTPMGGGRGYGPVHSQSLEKMFFGIPGLSVVAPSHFHNPGRELQIALAQGVPTLFIEHKLLYPKPLSPGKVLLLDQGHEVVTVRNHNGSLPDDIVVIAYGGAGILTQQVMERMAEEEIRITSVFPSLISPVSQETISAISEIVSRCGRAIVVEDGCEGFGWSDGIARRITEECFDALKAPVSCLASACTIIPACFSLEQELLVSAEKLEAAILHSLE